MSRQVENLIGKTFGFLTVIEGPFRSPRNKQRTRFEAAWKCRCICGNLWFVSSGHLKGGNVTSCGCQSSRINKKKSSTRREKVTA